MTILPNLCVHHRLYRQLREKERALEVDVEHEVPVLLLHPHEKRVPRDAGVVDQVLEAPFLFDDLFHGRFARGGVGDVQHDRVEVEAFRFEFRLSRLERLFLDVAAVNYRAFRGDQLGDRLSDTLRGSCYQRYLFSNLSFSSFCIRAFSVSSRLPGSPTLRIAQSLETLFAIPERTV